MALGCALLPSVALSYPLDGYEETGIRRVEGARLAHEGLALGGFQPPGALLTTTEVDVRLLDHPDLQLAPADPDFTTHISALLGENANAYGIAVLDLTDPDAPSYAEHRGYHRQNVGNVPHVHCNRIVLGADFRRCFGANVADSFHVSVVLWRCFRDGRSHIPFDSIVSWVWESEVQSLLHRPVYEQT